MYGAGESEGAVRGEGEGAISYPAQVIQGNSQPLTLLFFHFSLGKLHIRYIPPHI